MPTHDDQGNRLGGRPLQHAPNVTIVNQTINNTTVINNINNQVNTVVAPGYYWNNYGGMRYCRYYDDWGVNWFGFYVGSVYFWTRWHNDRLWWEDYQYHRWLYFHEGAWWWQDPDDLTIVYVYRDGDYYRYDRTDNGVVLQPAPPASQPDPSPSDPAPAPAPASDTWYYSDDGTRSVQVTGDEKTAFLYDATQQDADGNPQFLNYLTRNVVNVQFSDTSPDENGAAQPLQIVCTTQKDGGKQHVAVFDAQGVRFGAQPAPEPAPAPAATDGDSPSASSIGAGLRQSAAFRALQGGVSW